MTVVPEATAAFDVRQNARQTGVIPATRRTGGECATRRRIGLAPAMGDVTVFAPVHGGLPHLAAPLESLLAQAHGRAPRLA